MRAELDGVSISSLLEGPKKICAWKTYHGSGKSKGWKHNPAFDEALTLARRDYRKWLLEHGTSEAMLVLADTAPDASRLLRQRVRGDEAALAVLEAALQDEEPALRIKAAMALGATGLPQVVPALWAALEGEEEAEVRAALIGALGGVASGYSRDMRAAESVLDRAGTGEVASKASWRELARQDGVDPDEIYKELLRKLTASLVGPDADGGDAGGAGDPAGETSES